MLVEVEHLDSIILSAEVDNEYTVEDLKHAISRNMDVPESEMTLASNGSVLEDGHRFSEYCSESVFKVLLFLRRGEQIGNNIEVDFGHGKVVIISVNTNWRVSELKEKLMEKVDVTFDETKFLTFNRWIMEDDRTLEEYELTKGARIEVFTYLDRRSPNKATENNSCITNTSTVTDRAECDLNVERPKCLEQVETPSDQLSVSDKLSPGKSTAQCLSPSFLAGAVKVLPVAATVKESASRLQGMEGHSSRNSETNSIDHGSNNVRNGGENSKHPSIEMEPKVILVPGGFRQHQTKSEKNKSGFTSKGPFGRENSEDKMSITFTDGARTITVDMPPKARVLDAMEAVKKRISDRDKDRLRLFKGLVQLRDYHLLSDYGIVDGSTLTFK